MTTDSIIARDLLAEAGLRRTQAAQHLLELFIAKPGRYLSHTDIDRALRNKRIDLNRVTLYRLLTRLSQSGLLICHIGEDRISRFAYVRPGQPEQADSHFECQACQQHFHQSEPLAGVQRLLQELADDPYWHGHQLLHASLTIKGICAGCRSESV